MEKTKQEIREEMLNNLAISIGVNITDEGSVALAIVDSVLDEIYHLYQELEYAKQQAYLSTSQGYHTELIAQLVGTERDTYETDDELKLKASNSVYRNAKGNRIAIEEAVMKVAGVADIDYRPYGAGTGSFVLYVYPQPEFNQLRLLDDVREALKDVVADGIYYEVKQPTEVPIGVSMLVQFDEEISIMERQVVRNTIQSSLRYYLNNLKRNEVLYINELIRSAMDANKHILDVSVLELTVNGVGKQVSNTFPANDERFISGDIHII